MRAVNLIPADQRRSGVNLAGRSGGLAYVVLGLVFGLAVLALLYGFADREIGSKQAEANRLSAEAAEANAAASRLAPYTSFVALREERLKDVEELANTRFDWAHAMHELGRVLPSGAALSSVQATVGSSTTGGAAASPAVPAATSASSGGTAGASGASSPSVSSATPAGSTPTFTLAGCATSQSEVALTMDRLRLIDGVSSVTLQSSTKSGGGSGSGGSTASCPPGGPTFTLQVSFDALPQPTVKTPPVGVSSASDSSSTTSGRSDTGTVKTR